MPPKKTKKPTRPARKAVAQPEPDTHHLRRAQADGNFIRAWRLFRRIERQEDLAKMTQVVDPQGVGIPRVTICRLETGEYRYNEDHIKLISRALGVAPRDLIGTDPFDSGDIFAVYAGFDAIQKRKVRRLVNSITRKPRLRP